MSDEELLEMPHKHLTLKKEPSIFIKSKFAIGSVYHKYLVAQILSNLYGEHAIQLLWSSTKKSRSYIISNYEMLLKHYFTRPVIVELVQDSFSGITTSQKYAPKDRV